MTSQFLNKFNDVLTAKTLVPLTVVISLGYILLNFDWMKMKLMSLIFYFLRKSKIYKKFTKNKTDEVFATFEKELRKTMKLKSSITEMPLKGQSQESVLKMANEGIENYEAKWKNGFCSGTVYSANSQLSVLCGKVFEMFSYHNPLHFDIFPSVVKMEVECVKMISKMFNGDSETIGCISSGGTESIMLACKTYRDMALEKGIGRPTILVPKSAHCAFDKAANLFGMKLIHIDLKNKSMEVDIAQMEKYIDGTTCMLVGSAPNFPHGIVDPIEGISALGVKYSIPVHVDCCLGGFLVGFASDDLRKKLPRFDFRLPGVTSISCDPHKYGLTPKGISAVVYRNKNYMKYQYCIFPDWQGGFYSTVSFAGSRSGGLIAVCWVTFMYLGRQFYIDQCKRIVDAAQTIKKRISEIEEIEIIGDPQLSVIAFRTKSVNIFTLGDVLTERGWHLNFLQNPTCIHICVTEYQVAENVVDRLVEDIWEGVKMSEKCDNSQGNCTRVYGALATIPDVDVKYDFGERFLNVMMSPN